MQRNDRDFIRLGSLQYFKIKIGHAFITIPNYMRYLLFHWYGCCSKINENNNASASNCMRTKEPFKITKEMVED
jgi:hypothetical protein